MNSVCSSKKGHLMESVIPNVAQQTTGLFLFEKVIKFFLGKDGSGITISSVHHSPVSVFSAVNSQPGSDETADPSIKRTPYRLFFPGILTPFSMFPSIGFFTSAAARLSPVRLWKTGRACNRVHCNIGGPLIHSFYTKKGHLNSVLQYHLLNIDSYLTHWFYKRRFKSDIIYSIPITGCKRLSGSKNMRQPGKDTTPRPFFGSSK